MLAWPLCLGLCLSLRLGLGLSLNLRLCLSLSLRLCLSLALGQAWGGGTAVDLALPQEPRVLKVGGRELLERQGGGRRCHQGIGEGGGQGLQERWWWGDEGGGQGQRYGA